MNPDLDAPESDAECETVAIVRVRLKRVNRAPIRTDLIPEGSGDWSQAKRGLFYHPVKQQITLRLDADLIDWLV
jgi:uncharacterized protein (DUF4415 family)